MQFVLLGATWDAVPTGIGHGVGFFSAPVDRWGFVFKRVDDPLKEHRNHVTADSPDTATTDALKDALDEALVIDAIEGSKYTWRPAEAISRDTGIDIDRVRRILQITSRDVIVAPLPNKQGFTLYSTREHYQRREPFLNRFIDNVSSSS